MFKHVTIVGVGLLGASLGLALRQRRLAERVSGVGRAGSASLEVARGRGAIDCGYTELRAALEEGPELVVLCTPVRQFPGAFGVIREHLRGGIVTDVGSTKGQVMAWAEDVFGLQTPPDPSHLTAGSPPSRLPVFVGSHPMAGSEKRGPEAARADLYEGALCLMSPAAAGTDPDEAAFKKVEALWRGVGMRTLQLEPAVHDRWVAMVSHLPHGVAFALMNAAARHPEMLVAAAGGFLDTTRIASSDVEMWGDIFLTNRAAVLESMDEFAREFAAMRAAVAAGDEERIRELLAAAKRSREELLARRRVGNDHG